jgi:hypothetical protein
MRKAQFNWYFNLYSDIKNSFIEFLKDK